MLHSFDRICAHLVWKSFPFQYYFRLPFFEIEMVLYGFVSFFFLWHDCQICWLLAVGIWVPYLFICANYVTVLQHNVVFMLLPAAVVIVIILFCSFKSEFSIHTTSWAMLHTAAAAGVFRGCKKIIIKSTQWCGNGAKAKQHTLTHTKTMWITKFNTKQKRRKAKKINHYRWDPSFDVYFFSIHYYDCKSIK